MRSHRLARLPLTAALAGRSLPCRHLPPLLHGHHRRRCHRLGRLQLLPLLPLLCQVSPAGRRAWEERRRRVGCHISGTCGKHTAQAVIPKVKEKEVWSAGVA